VSLYKKTYNYYCGRILSRTNESRNWIDFTEEKKMMLFEINFTEQYEHARRVVG